MKITKLEMQGIENIALNLYTPINGAVPIRVTDAVCWSNCLTDGPHKLSGNVLSGIISSLVKKDLVWTDSESCGLTDEGFRLFTESRKPPEMSVSKAAKKWGSLGGKSRSVKKIAAVRENGKKGGRPRKQK